MHLTQAQKTALKNDIETNPAVTVLGGAYPAIVAYYNALASPAFIVWKPSVTLEDVVSSVDGGELAGMSQLNLTRYQCLLLAGFVNPSKQRTRDGFANTFSGAGGALTRTALDAMWRRSATRIEKLFATGTGTTAAPAALGFEGAIDAAHIDDALVTG